MRTIGPFVFLDPGEIGEMPEQAIYKALACRVLAVAVARLDYGASWTAYIDAVPGKKHEDEWQKVRDGGIKLPKEVAKAIFHGIPDELPYAL